MKRNEGRTRGRKSRISNGFLRLEEEEEKKLGEERRGATSNKGEEEARNSAWQRAQSTNVSGSQLELVLIA